MRGVKENSILKWMTCVTSAGDQLTFFAILMITHEIFGDIWLSSYNVAIQALAIAVGCVLVPKTLSNFKIKHVFVFTQVVSMLAVLTLYFLLQTQKVNSPVILYSTLFTVTTLWQLFAAARETLSKAQAKKDSEHRSFQAELLEGFFSAQIIGSLLAVFLIFKFGSYLPLLIDAISFGACAIMACYLKSDLKFERKVSLLKPLEYLPKKVELKKIFLLRTFGFWVPISIFNLVSFPMAEEQFRGIFSSGKEILGSAFFYALLGLGATVGNFIVRKGYFKSANIEDGKLAFYCQLVMATTMLLLIPNLNFIFNQIIFFINGTAMGINALATQTIRRKIATNEEFVEVVSLEPIIGRGVDYAIASLCILMPKSWWPVQLAFASLWFYFVAREHLSFDRIKSENSYKICRVFP